MVLVEFRVDLHCFDSRSPSGLPVIGDVEDMGHEDFEVNKNPAPEILAPDVVLVILAIVFIDPVRIVLLPLSDGRPTGEWGQIYNGGRAASALQSQSSRCG